MIDPLPVAATTCKKRKGRENVEEKYYYTIEKKPTGSKKLLRKELITRPQPDSFKWEPGLKGVKGFLPRSYWLVH